MTYTESASREEAHRMSNNGSPLVQAAHRTTIRLSAGGLLVLEWLMQETHGSITEVIESGLAAYADRIAGRMKREVAAQARREGERGHRH